MTRNAPLLAQRELILPQYLHQPQYVETYGPEVVDVCIAAGMTPDPEQAMGLDLIFALNAQGKSACFEIDWIAARQMMKTGLILMAELGWLFVTEQRLIVHSAHEMDTTQEAFRDLATLIEDCEDLSAELKPGRGERPGISEGNGRWQIELKNDQRVKYKARTKSGGRGLSGDKVVLDEGFALLPTHMGSLLGTLAARADPQVLIMSSAGKVDSTVLIQKRDEGRAGLGGPRRAYVEYGDKRGPSACAEAPSCSHAKGTPGCVVDDVESWGQWMPALGHRVQLDTILALRDSMPADEFCREFMVWWDIEEDVEPPAIDGRAWSLRGGTKSKKPDVVTVAVDVAPGRKSASIAVAGAGKKGRTLLITRTEAGTAWVVPALSKMLAKAGRTVLSVSLQPSTQAGLLIPALIQAGIEYTLLTQQEMGQACAGIQEAVIQGTLEHADQPELDAAVGNAVVRTVGEAELWDRRNPTIDISPLVAGSAAVFQWAKESDYDVEESIY